MNEINSFSISADQVSALSVMEGKMIERDWAKSVDILIDEVCQQKPEAIAIKSGNETISFGTLYEQTNYLAGRLLSGGIHKEHVVAIIMERSPNFIISMLGIWKASAAYIPIDPNLPQARIRQMIKDSSVKYLICSPSFLELTLGLKEDNVELEYICLDHEYKNYLPAFSENRFVKSDVVRSINEDDVNGSGSPTTKHRKVDAGDLAYVLFTSGSTGIPKGVMIEHGGMLNHKLSMVESFNINEDTVIAQTASQSFDISVWQFITALIKGGSTVIYSDLLQMDVEMFLQNLNEDKVNILELVPSYLNVVLEVIEDSNFSFSSLEYLIVTGEAASASLMERWFKLFPHIPVVNAYGPAEAGDDVSLHFMYEYPGYGSVPIGKPLQNMVIYILNSNDQVCQREVEGQICVSGIGVGRGYVNNMSSSSFTTDPISQTSRMYKTGDIGKCLLDGTLLYLGRSDNQVKIRGHRIELEEIEWTLAAIPEIAICSVIHKPHIIESEEAILAYVQVRQSMAITSEQIFLRLKSVLPKYMLPAKIFLIKEMPLLSNGKIDKQRLHRIVNSNS